MRLHVLVGGGTPDEVVSSVNWAVEEGFTAVKFDPLVTGYEDLSAAQLVGSACEMAAAAREAGGDEIDLIFELHRKLDPANAIVICNALARFNPLFIEDPIQIDSIATQAEIGKHIAAPIAMGERLSSIWEFSELLSHNVPILVRPDVGLAGGLSGCRKIAAIAEAHHCGVAPHNFLGPASTAPTLHLCLTIPNLVTMEYLPLDEDARFVLGGDRDGHRPFRRLLRGTRSSRARHQPRRRVRRDRAGRSSVPCRVRGCYGRTGRSLQPTGRMARSSQLTEPSLRAGVALLEPGRESRTGVGERMACERRDCDVHVRPERQARQGLVEGGGVGGTPDGAIRGPSRHAPNRSQDPRLGQRPSPGVLGLLQRGPVLRVEVDGEAEPLSRPGIPSAATSRRSVGEGQRVSDPAREKGSRMASVTFKDTTRIYPKSNRRAVDRLNLEIGDGEFLVLVGPSGCGKTTSLRMLAGLEDIDEGSISIDDQDVTTVAPRNRDIAMVFQNYALYPHMNVAENMGFALLNARVRKSEIAARVRAAARILDLEEYLDRKPGQLSGGQRQRVAMGRAIVREPRVFLMDEPLSNLDAKLRVSTRAQIAALQQRLGVTTVYVTHDQVEAMTMGHRVAVMKDGVLQQCDTPRGLYQAPVNAFVAGFIGSPAMNLIEGTIVEDGVMLGSTVMPVPRELGERVAQTNGRTATVTVGMRPEFLELVSPGEGFPAVVNLVEELGAEAYVYAQMADHRNRSVTAPSDVVARVLPTTAPRNGDLIHLRVQEGTMLLFDVESGARIA